MLTVDQELLEKIVTVVDEELSSSSDLKDQLSSIARKPKQLEAVLKTVRDTASYLCRKELSGKEFKTPFEILIEVNNLIAKAKIDTVAGIKGIPLGVADTVQLAINKRLKEELDLIESAVRFSQQASVTDATGLAVLEKLWAGKRVNGIALLKVIHDLSGERTKQREIQQFTAEDQSKLQSLVANGKIYMFQAKNLVKALTLFYHSGNGEEILRELGKLEPLRR